MENILEIKNLCKKYNDFELKKVNLNLPKGMIMGFIGENGAGKTTTIKAILDIIKKDDGLIKIFGEEQSPTSLKQIGVVLDDSFFPEILNPKDINKIMASIHKNWDSNLYYEYLEQFSLPKDKQIKTFSKGMRKKLEIITALSHHPKLLILDEPTSGWDPIARNEIIQIFQNFIQNEESSILLSSHIISDLEHIADYITLINKGQIILTKTCDELLNNYGIIKCGEKDFLKIKTTDYLKFIKTKYEYQVLVENKKEFQKKYENYIVDKISLEDLMLLMIKGEE